MDAERSLMFTPGAVCQTPTRRSGSGNGRGLSSTLWITLKMAVLAPIPSARVISVARVNTGVRARRRNVCFKSRIRSYKHFLQTAYYAEGSNSFHLVFIDGFAIPVG